jgi:hypothetical protein
MQKTVLIAVAAAVICGAAGFYGGMLYSQSQTKSQFAFSLGQGGVPNATGDTQRFGGAGGTGMRQGGANFVTGEILSKEDSSLTVKLRDGGSRIVLLSNSTTVSKATEASKDDLTVGQAVMISGSSNSDGSLTAQTISLNPQMPGVGMPEPTQVPPVQSN